MLDVTLELDLRPVKTIYYVERTYSGNIEFVMIHKQRVQLFFLKKDNLPLKSENIVLRSGNKFNLPK